MGRRYYITDVFATGPYSGNQLATVVDTEGVTAAEMQQIARAFNFAETTFVTGGDLQAGFDVRIFTPVAELPFAGHPTLGTAYLLRHEIHSIKADVLTLNLGVGKIPVEFAADGVLWMNQIQPTFKAGPNKATAASYLGLDESDLMGDFNPQYVSTGLEFLLVPLVNLDALQRCRGVQTEVPVLAFTTQGYNEQFDISARMFAGELGVSEDPATGSANGCLAAYLCEHALLGKNEAKVTVAQGFEIGRPSALFLDAHKQADNFTIRVGGRVNLVSTGEWCL